MQIFSVLNIFWKGNDGDPLIEDDMIKRIIGIISRFFLGIPRFFSDASEFNVKVAFWRYLAFCIPSKKGSGYIEAISEYMNSELSVITEKYNRGEFERNAERLYDMKDKIPVFVCWWQGEESMPPLVATCVRRIKKKIPCDCAQLHLITYENYSDYVELPKFVVEKHKKGIISSAHFSDVLRFSLLKTYGGMWIDSTVFLSDHFSFDFFDKNFYTQKYSSPKKCPGEACVGKWCGFFMYGQASLQIFNFVYDSLLFWWKKHDIVVDYVFFDYIIMTGYGHLPMIKEVIDQVEPNNENMWLMANVLNDPYDDSFYAELMRKNGFYKLSYKGNYVETLHNGNKTIYGYIVGKE